MWHPYSILYADSNLYINDSHILTNSQGIIMPDAQSMGFRAVTPPRGTSNSTVPGTQSLHQLILQWAERQKISVLSTHHAVLDAERRDIYPIDYIMQDKHGSYIAMVYVSPNRMGVQLKEMTAYIKQITSVCNLLMDFHPTALVICVYGTIHPKIYASRIKPNAPPVASMENL